MKIKSTIKQLHEIDFTKQFVLTELRADKGTVEQHKTRLSGMFPKDTPEQINMKISNIVVRDNIFNLIMNEVAKSYEINYDQEELKTVIERIKPQFSNHKEEILTEIAKKTIAKALIFEILAKR
jgi:FKBP-type peptidyl-prolyl cis-trans isomerase (trigger factor)